MLKFSLIDVSNMPILILQSKINFMTNLPSAKRHFSHVTKNRIFKNLNLRKKADRNFAAISWKTISGTYWYVEVHHQRRLKSTKTGIFS